MPWHHGTPGPTVRAEPAKETGPNGQAVGPGIHAEAGMNALGRSRTFNLQIKSLLLCQLSYECKILKRRRGTCLVVRPKRLTPTTRHPPTDRHAVHRQVARQEGLEPPTHSLEGCRSIQLSYWRNGQTDALCHRAPQVGAPGFEPGTSCSQSRRDTRLRYAPLRPILVGSRNAVNGPT
jgi:hypothetical protein